MLPSELKHDLERLAEFYEKRGFYDYDACTAHRTIAKSWLPDLIEETERLRRGARILDLGSGFGLPLAAFAHAGFFAYGIEENFSVAKESLELIEAALATIDFTGRRPEVLVTNYFNPGFPMVRFRDGSRPRDMEGFYVFAYDEYGEDGHLARVKRMVKGIAKPGSRLIVMYLDGGDPSLFSRPADGSEEERVNQPPLNIR